MLRKSRADPRALGLGWGVTCLRQLHRLSVGAAAAAEPVAGPRLRRLPREVEQSAVELPDELSRDIDRAEGGGRRASVPNFYITPMILLSVFLTLI